MSPSPPLSSRDLNAPHSSIQLVEARGLPPSAIARACCKLFVLSFRRQFFSRQTLVCLGLSLLLGAIVVAWSFQRNPTEKKFAEQVLITTFVGFLLPILAISFGASCIGGEREDRTLIYLLMVPIPKPLAWLSKSLAAILLVWCWSIVVLYVDCQLAGPSGKGLFSIFLPAVLLGGLAYTSLFALIGTVFRHGTIISLAYWFFLEVLFGAMPGLIKRITVSFYIKSCLYDVGSEIPLRPLGRIAREMFLAVEGSVAQTVMVCASFVFLGLAAWAFQRHQYPELG